MDSCFSSEIGDAADGIADLRLTDRVHQVSDPSAELDGDTLNAILVRLVAEVSSTALHLITCLGVCRLWYAGALNDELWRVLFLRKWRDKAQTRFIEPDVNHTQYWHEHPQWEPVLSFRAKYIRSVTTQVLVWGQAERQGGHSSAPRSAALLEPDGLRGAGVRQVSAGASFSCIVLWSGDILCWGVNSQVH